MNSNYSSRLLENTVNELTRLPGIGRRTAIRLALHLLRQDEQKALALGNAIINLRSQVKYCKRCHNLSDDELCNICKDLRRDQTLLCVVEDLRDVMAVENTMQYRGLYHVLGGVISPMDGIGPGELNIDSLINRLHAENTAELIMALPATTEGDTTSFYIYKRMNEHHKDVKLSTLSRGVAIGDELQYADEITLGRSILNRVPYHNAL
ncbi:MAG: recombination mediator RecR [Lentimicrobium sp.]|jgi:recombination protein RecR|nr:recombination mediator RecR [Lentimicrobium sp.]